MKILVTPTSFLNSVNDEARKKIENFATEVVYNDLKRPLQGEEIIERAAGISGYLAGIDYITADIIEKLPDSLKVISRYGIGYDRIDIAAARKKGILVTNTPGANSNAVCELAFGMMLSAARKIPEMDRMIRANQWHSTNGIELNGKTLGIIGLGAIGKRLAVRARAFEMNVLAYDPFIDRTFAERNQISAGDDPKFFARLIQSSDFISLHLPITQDTFHIINKEQIEQMKKGVILINTARGGLIDEDAALSALHSGKIGVLALDAYEAEPLPADSPLILEPNVILTPHTGAHTVEANQAMGMQSVDNLIAVLSGKECKTIVN